MKQIIYLFICILTLDSCEKESITTYSLTSDLPITIYNCRTFTADHNCQDCFENIKILNKFGTINPYGQTKTVSTKATKFFFGFNYGQEDHSTFYASEYIFNLTENTYNEFIIDRYGPRSGPLNFADFDK